MIEQQEVKNFSRFNKPLTMKDIFMNQSFDSCSLAYMYFKPQKPSHRVQGPTYQEHSYWTDPSCAASYQGTEIHWISKLASKDRQVYVTTIFQIHQTRGGIARWCYQRAPRKKKKEREGRMPTNLNQTQVNQLFGDGEVGISFSQQTCQHHRNVSRKRLFYAASPVATRTGSNTL